MNRYTFHSIVLPFCIPHARVDFVSNPLDSILVSKMHPISSVRVYIQYFEQVSRIS